MHPVRAYALLVRAGFRGQLQYRGNFLLMVTAGLCYQGIGIAFIWAVLDRFDSIGGWALPEIALLYAIRLTAHGLWLVPFAALMHVDGLVLGGGYDRLLLRPVSPLVQILGHHTQISTVGDLAGGLALLVAAGLAAPVRWTPGTVAFLAVAVVGGALAEAALQLAVSALSFRLLSVQSLRLVVDDMVGTFGNYPVHVFGAAAQFGLTFLLPLAFVAYLPAAALLGRGGELLVPAALAWASPAVGTALFAVACWFWHRQARHYASTGS